MKTGKIVAAVLVLAWALSAYGQVVINEFSYDDSSTDDAEFVELYNPGGAAVDISGWQLRASNTVGPPDDNNADYTIPANTILPAGGYYVIGTDSGKVANVNQTVGTTNLWENSNEAIELLDGGGAVRDTVIYELNKGPVAVGPAEGGIWGNAVLIEGTNQSVARWTDGRDTNNNGRDFGLRPATPGANNLGSGSLISHYSPPNVDALGVGTDAPGLTGSFVNARVIDPALADANNPNAIPAPPQGGNAIIAWDPSGGGNMVASDDTIQGSSYTLDAYLDTNPIGNIGAESTTYGILGTTGSYYNLPDPSGTFFGDYVTANGNTGIGWLFEKEDSAGIIDLHLVDFGGGGDSSDGPLTPRDWRIITTIDLSNMPSDWYRLIINYDSATGAVEARFGDQVFTFNTETGLVGSFYVGFRESELGNGAPGVRPPTFDLVPEPATLWLLALGGLPLLRRRRRA